MASLLTEVVIMNYHINQTLLLALVKYYRTVDVVGEQAADHNYPTRKIGFLSNFKKFPYKYLLWSLSSLTLLAESCTSG